MCTVTFIARENGYALGMNRDEKLSRVQGLAPAKHLLSGRSAIFPSEPGGGTWIGANDAGVTFALINWYSVPARVSHNSMSRGAVTRSVLALDDLAAAGERLAHLPLENTNPFRLVGIFPESTALVEWRWNLSTLERVVHDWKTNIWISSGFDEPGAQAVRQRAFASATRYTRAPDSNWLRELHSSHEPRQGAYSICMHRRDAATVSYTEIGVDAASVRVAYSPTAPCGHAPMVSTSLTRQSPRNP